jgi:hypothetical protein
VIVKAGGQLRGTRTYGLLAYLLGPGRHTEHVDPRVVAAWVPVDQLASLGVDASGRVSSREVATCAGKVGSYPAVKDLAVALEAPMRAITESRRPSHHVWHCVVQNDARVDPVLSDAQWAVIAEALVASVGLDGCRWVAVRHDDHGIHLAATLAAESGTRPRLSYEKRKLNACRVQLEARYCRRRTDPGTRTGGIAYQRHELEKAHREGATQPAKVRLRNAVRRAAIATTGPAGFESALRADGVQVGWRFSSTSPDQITGYKVALRGHTTATGDLVWYKASDIDRALTWPKLQARWTVPGPARGDRTDHAISNECRARLRIAERDLRNHPDAAAAWQESLSDLATALVGDPDGNTDLAHYLDNVTWSGHPPHDAPAGPQAPPSVSRLLASARLLAIAARANPRRPSWSTVAMQVAATLQSLSRAHAAANRRRQAEQAHAAASYLRQAHAADPRAARSKDTRRTAESDAQLPADQPSQTPKRSRTN